MAAKPEHLSPQEAARRNIPAVVRILMQWRGVSRLDVMQATGTSKQTLSERLAGKSPFKDYELIALADLLGVEPGIFFKDPGDLITTCFNGPSLVPPYDGQLELPFPVTLVAALRKIA